MGTCHSDSQPIKQVSIAQDGDTKMMVGKGNQQTEFCVSSAILKMVSKVFAICFEPGKFAEGQSRDDSEDAFYHIAFPEDDACVMHSVLKLIHYQSEDLPCVEQLANSQIGAQEIYELASIAEKYLMWGPLTILYRLWMNRIITSERYNSNDHLRLLTAAALARDSRSFRHWSGKLIIHDESNFETSLNGLVEVLPEGTIRKLLPYLVPEKN